MGKSPPTKQPWLPFINNSHPPSKPQANRQQNRSSHNLTTTITNPSSLLKPNPQPPHHSLRLPLPDIPPSSTTPQTKAHCATPLHTLPLTPARHLVAASYYCQFYCTFLFHRRSHYPRYSISRHRHLLSSYLVLYQSGPPEPSLVPFDPIWIIQLVFSVFKFFWLTFLPLFKWSHGNHVTPYGPFCVIFDLYCFFKNNGHLWPFPIIERLL